MKKAYWWKAVNFGDTLTPIVLEHFLGEPIEYTTEPGNGRIVGVGSIAHHSKTGDVVWGAGSNRPGKVIDGSGIKFLAVRGPFTRSQVKNAVVPQIYGDPALLLPIIYHPDIKKTHAIGYLPHYVDKQKVLEKYTIASGYNKIIDIQADWKTVIDEILSCEQIISSSLHGIIAAEAYGIPAVWEVYSDKIIGGEYKFQDYFLGTGRPEQKPGEKIPGIKKETLETIQKDLINQLKNI